jgi:hypothetical protein
MEDLDAYGDNIKMDLKIGERLWLVNMIINLRFQ